MITPPCEDGTVTMAIATASGKPSTTIDAQAISVRIASRGGKRRRVTISSVIPVRPAIDARMDVRNHGFVSNRAMRVAGRVAAKRQTPSTPRSNPKFCLLDNIGRGCSRDLRKPPVQRTHRAYAYTGFSIAKIGEGLVRLRAEPSSYGQPTCKPGSVWLTARAANVTAIHLGRRLPGASSNLPERLVRTDLRPKTRSSASHRSYSVLLPVGFTVPFPLPETRCALAAPFHPCRRLVRYAPEAVCFSVALSPSFSAARAEDKPAGRYPAPFVRGARTFLPAALSGPWRSGRPVD